MIAEPELVRVKTTLCTRRLSPFLRCHPDNLTVTYIGGGHHAMDFGTIRANRAAQADKCWNYFEIEIPPGCGNVIIGYTHRSFSPNVQLGYEPSSFGFGGDGARCTFADLPTVLDSTAFSSGTIGCLINPLDFTMLLVIQGELTNNKFRIGAESSVPLFPAVSLHSPGDTVTFNLDGPFKFDLQKYVQAQYASKIERYRGALAGPADTAAITLDFLVHYGYMETFKLAKQPTIPLAKQREPRIHTPAKVAAPRDEYAAILAEGLETLVIDGADGGYETMKPQAYVEALPEKDHQHGMDMHSDLTAPASPYAASVMSPAEVTPFLRPMAQFGHSSTGKRSVKHTPLTSRSPYFDGLHGPSLMDAFELPPAHTTSTARRSILPPVQQQQHQQAAARPDTSELTSSLHTVQAIRSRLRVAAGAGALAESAPSSRQDAMALFRSGSGLPSSAIREPSSELPHDDGTSEGSDSEDGGDDEDGDDDDAHNAVSLSDTSDSGPPRMQILRQVLRDRLVSILEGVGTRWEGLRVVFEDMEEGQQPARSAAMDEDDVRENSAPPVLKDMYGYETLQASWNRTNSGDYYSAHVLKLQSLEARAHIRSLLRSQRYDQVVELLQASFPQTVTYPPHAAFIRWMLDGCKVLESLAAGRIMEGIRTARSSFLPFLEAGVDTNSTHSSDVSALEALHMANTDFAVSARCMVWLRTLTSLFALGDESIIKTADTLQAEFYDTAGDVINAAILERDVRCADKLLASPDADVTMSTSSNGTATTHSKQQHTRPLAARVLSVLSGSPHADVACLKCKVPSEKAVRASALERCVRHLGCLLAMQPRVAALPRGHAPTGVDLVTGISASFQQVHARLARLATC